jgi:hypothetical protein
VFSALVVVVLVAAFLLIAGVAGWVAWRLWSPPGTAPDRGTEG